MNPHESPIQTAIREMREETGYRGRIRCGDFIEHEGYVTLLCEVADEFAPTLNWESDAYEWCLPQWGHHPVPLHPGLSAIVSLVP